MKSKLLVACSVLMLCLWAGEVQAQEKQKVKMSLLKQAGPNVTLTITSPNEFYIGGTPMYSTLATNTSCFMTRTMKTEKAY